MENGKLSLSFGLPMIHAYMPTPHVKIYLFYPKPHPPLPHSHPFSLSAQIQDPIFRFRHGWDLSGMVPRMQVFLIWWLVTQRHRLFVPLLPILHKFNIQYWGRHRVTVIGLLINKGEMGKYSTHYSFLKSKWHMLPIHRLGLKSLRMIYCGSRKYPLSNFSLFMKYSPCLILKGFLQLSFCLQNFWFPIESFLF